MRRCVEDAEEVMEKRGTIDIFTPDALKVFLFCIVFVSHFLKCIYLVLSKLKGKQNVLEMSIYYSVNACTTIPYMFIVQFQVVCTEQKKTMLLPKCIVLPLENMQLQQKMFLNIFFHHTYSQIYLFFFISGASIATISGRSQNMHLLATRHLSLCKFTILFINVNISNGFIYTFLKSLCIIKSVFCQLLYNNFIAFI